MKINLCFDRLIEIIEKLPEIFFTLLFVIPLNLLERKTYRSLTFVEVFHILDMYKYPMNPMIAEEVVSLRLITLDFPYHFRFLGISHRVCQYREFLERNKRYVAMNDDYLPRLDGFLSL